MHPFLKILLVLICTSFLAATVFLSLKGGDILINYLADSLDFKISYANRCGFFSAFVLKTAHLEDVLLEGIDNPLKVECRDADIWFDYSNILKGGAIALHCQFNEPLFLSKSVSDEETFIEILPTLLFSMLGKTADFKYDTIFCDLLMYGDTAEVLSFSANSSSILMKAKGALVEDGKVNIDLKVFFSPSFAAGLPEEAQLVLEEKNGGWMSFHIRIKASDKEPFFQLESDRFRLSIGEDL